VCIRLSGASSVKVPEDTIIGLFLCIFPNVVVLEESPRTNFQVLVQVVLVLFLGSSSPRKFSRIEYRLT